MFFGFRKKKKHTLTEKEKKWNLLCDKYADGSLEENYFILFDYHAAINGEGHHCFFDNKSQNLTHYVNTLKTLLPNDFFAEFFKAYTAYISDDSNIENICDLADAYFYENENLIIDILQAYADSL
ncbi:MAG: hypothetical protein K2M95_07120 [Clostridiales bacterium]|nr:hypothetical protein [Clostridiales bacterium]